MNSPPTMSQHNYMYGYAPNQQWHGNTSPQSYPPSSPTSYHSSSPVSPHNGTQFPPSDDYRQPHPHRQTFPQPSQQLSQQHLYSNQATYSYASMNPPGPPQQEPPRVYGGPLQHASPTHPQHHPYSQYQEPHAPSPHFQSAPYAQGSQRGAYANETTYEDPDYADRPFQCDLCSLSFNRGHDLKRHRETHRGDKPFSCNGGCGKTFTRKDALKRHQIVKNCGAFETES